MITPVMEKRLQRLQQDYDRLRYRGVVSKEQQRAIDGARASAKQLLKRLHALPLHWLPETGDVLRWQDELPELISLLDSAQSIGKPITKGWRKRALSLWLHTLYDDLQPTQDYIDFLSYVLPRFGIDNPESFARIPPLE